MPCARHAGHDGRQRVRRLAREQQSGAIWQVQVSGEHGINSLQVPAVFQRSGPDPHLVVVAVFQHLGSNSAGGTSRRRLRVCLRPQRLRSSLHHHPEVVRTLRGCPVFQVREAIIWWDVERVGAQLRRGSRPGPGAWCRPGLGWWGDQRVCPGQVQDPYPPLVQLLGVEPPDPHVWGTLSRAEERLELPHADAGSSKSEEGRREAPVGADVVELRPEGFY